MEQTRPGADLQRPAASTRATGSGALALPLAETIDLSGPISYSDSFVIRCRGGKRKTTELRVGEAQDYLFVRVKCDGMMMELSSGLLHEGVRCEAWHGVTSGGCVKDPLLLQYALKFDGQTFKLDLRVQGGGSGGETLIYGSGQFQGAAFGATAEVGLHDVTAEEGFNQASPGTILHSTTSGAKGSNGSNGQSRPARPAPRSSKSAVRFCPSDQWYEYEVPAPVRVPGGR